MFAIAPRRTENEPVAHKTVWSRSQTDDDDDDHQTEHGSRRWWCGAWHPIYSGVRQRHRRQLELTPILNTIHKP